MPTVRETVQFMAEVTGAPVSRVNQIARRLLDDGLLPKSSGKDIKHINSFEAGLLLCAVAHTDTVANASKVAQDFASLPYRGEATTIWTHQDNDNRQAVSNLLPEKSGNWTFGDWFELLFYQIKDPCEITLMRGSDGRLRAQAIMRFNESEIAHNFYQTMGAMGGWGFTLGEEAVNALQDFLANNREADG